MTVTKVVGIRFTGNGAAKQTIALPHGFVTGYMQVAPVTFNPQWLARPTKWLDKTK